MILLQYVQFFFELYLINYYYYLFSNLLLTKLLFYMDNSPEAIARRKKAAREAKRAKRKLEGSVKKFHAVQTATEGSYDERKDLKAATIRLNEALIARSFIENESQDSTCRVLVDAAEYEIAEIESRIHDPKVVAERQSEANWRTAMFEYSKTRDRNATRKAAGFKYDISFHPCPKKQQK
jgi:hypothetical protein